MRRSLGRGCPLRLTNPDHLRIGAITDERMASFFDKMVRVQVVKPTVNFRRAYTLRFVNKAVGMDIRPKN